MYIYGDCWFLNVLCVGTLEKNTVETTGTRLRLVFDGGFEGMALVSHDVIGEETNLENKRMGGDKDWL